MKFIDKILKSVFSLMLLAGIVMFLMLFNSYIKSHKTQSDLLSEQVKIQRESHILGIYSTYKSNMDLCKSDATNQKKDQEYIQANCVEALNSSILGASLKDWGKEDLLIKQ